MAETRQAQHEQPWPTTYHEASSAFSYTGDAGNGTTS
jgi:hypothetical protein